MTDLTLGLLLFAAAVVLVGGLVAAGAVIGGARLAKRKVEFGPPVRFAHLVVEDPTPDDVVPIVPDVDAAMDEALALVGPPTLREERIEVPREGAVPQGRHRIHDECLDHYRTKDRAHICDDCWPSFYGTGVAS